MKKSRVAPVESRAALMHARDISLQRNACSDARANAAVGSLVLTVLPPWVVPAGFAQPRRLLFVVMQDQVNGQDRRATHRHDEPDDRNSERPDAEHELRHAASSPPAGPDSPRGD